MVFLNVCVNVKVLSCVFFFQAEDGIRDAQESRGLGDVYKRHEVSRQVDPWPHSEAGRFHRGIACAIAGLAITMVTVSYTHLTLPTIYSV